MAKAKSKSLLATKLGAAGRKAVKEHAGDDTDFGMSGDLPAGIEGGVAQIVECKFDTYKKGDNKGDIYFQARGVIISPKEFAGEIVEGRQTMIMEPVCDTPSKSRKDISEHIAWVMNEFRKLGIETEGAGIDDLEDFAETVKEEVPCFKFRTWKGDPTDAYPNPRVNHQWKGITETTEGEEEEKEDGVVVKKSRQTQHQEPEEETEAVEEEEEEEEEEVDLEELGKLADEEDEEAAKQLQDLADTTGLDAEDYETWSDLAKVLGKDTSEESESEEEDKEEEELAPPEKGESYEFKPPRSRKPVSVEVTAVFIKKETCNLKTEAGNVFKSVPWDKLIM